MFIRKIALSADRLTRAQRELEDLQDSMALFTRAGRRRRAPAWIRDMQPTSMAGLPEHIRPQRPPTPPPPPPDTAPPLSYRSDPRECTPTPQEQTLTPPVDTRPNRFGVFRRYFGALPSRDPEEGLTINAFTDARTHLRPAQDDSRDPLRPFGTEARRAVISEHTKSLGPFANISILRCMRWLYTGSNQKTPEELNRLVRDVFMAPEYRREDLVGFDARRENKRLDEYVATSDAFAAADGWRQASVFIRLPKEGHAYASEQDAPQFEVKNIFLRSFREVITAAYKDKSVNRFHWFPFRWLWQRKSPTPETPPPPPERLISETYNSDAMLRLHEEIQKKAQTDREPGDADDVEYVVAPIQIYSDSTHLANFGTASLWPIYLFFGSLTKYIRCRPNAFATHHLAYIVSVWLSISVESGLRFILTCSPAPRHHTASLSRDLPPACFGGRPAFLQARTDEPNMASSPRRRLRASIRTWHPHQVRRWYHTSSVPTSPDVFCGLSREVHHPSSIRCPRSHGILTLISRCLIACIRHLGQSPCPACLVSKGKVHEMGMVRDMNARQRNIRSDSHAVHRKIEAARKQIFERGIPPEGAAVEAILQSESLTPIRVCTHCFLFIHWH